MITHSMTKQQVDLLFVSVAKPVVRNDQVVWVAPLWWQVLRITAREDK